MTLTALFLFASPGSLFGQQISSAKQSVIRQAKGKTYRLGNRLFHITPTGDTIVSSLNGPNGNFFEGLNKEAEAKQGVENGPSSDPLSPLYGLNSYVPAHDSTYSMNLNFYGSGDSNGDGVFNWKDTVMTYSSHPYYDGTYRDDVNLDGVVNAQDKEIIIEALKEGKKGLNVWELQTAAQKLEHFKKALAIDPTNKVNAAESGWVCYDYSGQLYVNFNGVYDIKKSIFATDNGTNVQQDIKHNGIFGIPMRDVYDWTSDGIAHSIDVVYMGSPKQQDAGKFDYWVFVEPQTDKIQKVGDYSLARSVQVKWYGYFYSSFLNRWLYGSRDLLDYNLNSNGTTTKTHQTKDFVMKWNPMEKVKYPKDKVLEYPADTSTKANGVPTNLYGLWAEVSHNDSSTQTHDGTASEVNYNVIRTWKITEGAYNPSNTPDATHKQKIKVEDTQPPTYEKGANGPIDVKDNSSLPVKVTSDTTSTRGTNPNQCSYYTYTKDVKYTLTDVSGNSDGYDTLENIVDKAPYLTKLPIDGKDTAYVDAGASISPDSIPNGWATWKDPENAPMKKSYKDTLVKKTSLYKLWYRTETVRNPCKISPDSAFYDVEQKLPLGVRERTLSNKVLIYPNPIRNDRFTLRYSSLKAQEIKIVLYNIQGQKLEGEFYRLNQGKNEIPFHLTNLKSGMYFLELEDSHGHVEVVRFMVKR